MSDERQKVLTLMILCKDIAQRAYDFLRVYSNDVAALDAESRAFIINTWHETKPLIPLYELKCQAKFMGHLIETENFADIEAKFIQFAYEFFSAARITLVRLADQKQEHPDKYQHWPEAKQRLQEMYLIIDEEYESARFDIEENRRARMSALEAALPAKQLVKKINDLSEDKQSREVIAAEYGVTRQAIDKRIKKLFPAMPKNSRLSAEEVSKLCFDLENHPPRKPKK